MSKTTKPKSWFTTRAWLFATIFALVVVAAGAAASHFMESRTAGFRAVASVAVGVSLFLAFVTLYDTFEWNRRHFTVTLIGQWNDQTRKHMRIVCKKFPRFDCSFYKLPLGRALDRITDADKELMRMITDPSAAATAEKKRDFEDLQDHVISLLNYFEDIATADELSIVVHESIRDSYQHIILSFCRYFELFINEMKLHESGHPWPPLERLIQRWKCEQ